MTDSPSPAPEPDDRAKNSFLPGITLLSVSTILLGLVVIGFMIQVGNVHAGGDLVLRLKESSGTIRADGKVVISGRIDADTIRAREVHIGKKDVSARRSRRPSAS